MAAYNGPSDQAGGYNGVYYYHQSIPPQGSSQQQYPYHSIQQTAPFMSPPTSNRQVRSIKSPRQQFSDSLRRGVQSFAPTPSNNADNLLGTDNRRTFNAALPARPDSAIRAAQATMAGDNGSPSMTASTNISNSSPPNRLGAPTSMTTLITGPPRPAPSLPLSSRFPPLPSLPPLSDEATIGETELRKAFEEREKALLLRIDALGFQPEAAWLVMQEASGVANVEDVEVEERKRELPAPVLGIRLLQRLDLLQRENEELEQLFGASMQRKNNSELQDAHRLIMALDTGLYETTKRAEQAEAKAASLEQALAIACDQRSMAITSSDSNQQNTSPSASPPWKRAAQQTSHLKIDHKAE